MSNQQWEQVTLKKILDRLRTADDYLQVYSFIFGLCAVSIWDEPRPWQLVAVPKLKVLCSRLCCRDIDPNRQNTEHSLEEQFWNFAPVRSARLLWWFPRQAKPSLHGGSRRTWNNVTGHEISNQQWEEPNLPQHKPGSPWQNWWLPTTSQLHFFALHNLYLRPFYTMVAGSCQKVAILAPTLLAPNDQNSIEEQVLNLATTPATVAPVRLARLLWWLPRRAKQSVQHCWRRTSIKRHWLCNVKSAMRTGHPQENPGSP